MIHYQLQCKDAHAFDGWFKDSATFEKQAARVLIECPQCGDTTIERALMAPAVTSKKGDKLPVPVQAGPPAAFDKDKVAAGPLPAQMMAMLQRMRVEVEKHCDYVGPKFAEEARRIHRGEVDERPIYGEATEEQAESLAEDGISVARIPWVPRADG
ncbi:MAG: DUF1178 family protein [Rhodopila sp.]